MIQLKNKSELERMKKACQISAQALVVAGENIRAGMTTLELDRILHHFIVSQGAKPSFLGYGGFPGTALYFGERRSDPWDSLFGAGPAGRGHRQR